ncbi:hypothetical protein PHJA_000385700 [Phtheirospermum japonicum]|uniref:SAM domain-containing protein n=1 Tax=Phtheirospermum japonicum TaxID=374723 RepID=A0A830B5S2_9LAMI|nr:hypothetical protein PHJA_000385700 [Phtheirospermum japonicum]
MWGWKNYLSTGKRKKFIVSPSCSIEDEENEKSVAFSSSGGGEEKEVEGDFGENTKNGVGAWLGRLELERYASLFHAHEVDEAVLPFLTIDDLKDMGISAVGTRRKMLRSIEKLPR